MKKLLLYMTDFYGYHSKIIKTIEDAGWEVTWYQDKVNLNYFERAFSKLFKKYKFCKYDKYFNKTLKEHIGEKFDRILIIFGANFFTGNHIKKLRKNFPNARIVYYAWDSVTNFPKIKELFEHADLSYTFDPIDASYHNVNFLPLFYTNTSNMIKIRKDYDLSSVMSLYIEKCDMLNDALHLVSKDKKTFLYFKVRDKHYLNRLKKKKNKFYLEFKESIKINKLAYEKCIDCFSCSKAVLDIPLPNQVGLTMRTFEVLSLHTKLITTNKSIKEYDFYSPNNIYILDGNEIPDSFFETKFDENFSLDKKYSLTNFVSVLLGKD